MQCLLYKAKGLQEILTSYIYFKNCNPHTDLRTIHFLH